MSFLKKLFGIGATAAATVAAVRVSDKFKENNPDGVGDLNGDGVVDTKDVVIGVKNAAKEVYEETVGIVREKAPEFTEKVETFVDDVVDEVRETAADVKAEAKEIFADMKQTASALKDEAAEAYEEVKEAVGDAADDVAAAVTEEPAYSPEETPIL